jgi:hypothetical protein
MSVNKGIKIYISHLTLYRLKLHGICQYSVRTTQKTHSSSFIKTDQLVLYKEIIAVTWAEQKIS